MRIPDRHKQLEVLTREYLTKPKAGGEENGRRQDSHARLLSDEDVIALCRKAKNAAKFADLFDAGSVSAYDGDDSSADLALVSMLAFYTQDEDQLDRLFRRSALYREEKWGSRPDYRRRTIDKALCNLTETYTPSHSHHIHEGFGENKSTLPIKTVEEVISEAGESVPWIIEDVLARGALTEFSGLAKKGGKTTFWCHAIVAGAREQDHAGFHTDSAKYLYLTEQGNNFAQALQESGLVDYPDHVSIIRFKDVSGRKWDTLINQAGIEANKRGFDVLVVDTFAVFAGLRGSEENDAGPVADRMRVLRLVAQKYNIAVVLIRHAGKDGTPRGSSAFEAEADICITLSRPEGRHDPSVRRIAGIGRYGEWERNIQLKDGRYVSLGTDNKIEFNKAVRFIKAVLPENPDTGLKKQDLLNKRAGDDEDISASTLARALEWLVKQGEAGAKQLMNERGRPKVYWRAYNPPAGGGKEDGIYSHQTPSPNGQNK